MSLAARVVRVVRANLTGHLGGVRRNEGRTPFGRSGSESRTERRPEPPPPPIINPTLARYYANLELPYGAGREAVRAARRRLLSRYHPDRFTSDQDKARLASELVKRLNQAHDELIKHLEKENHG